MAECERLLSAFAAHNEYQSPANTNSKDQPRQWKRDGGVKGASGRSIVVHSHLRKDLPVADDAQLAVWPEPTAVNHGFMPVLRQALPNWV